MPGVGQVRLRLLSLFALLLQRLLEIRRGFRDPLLKLDHLLHLVAGFEIGSPALLLGRLRPGLLGGGLRGGDLLLKLNRLGVLFLLQTRERSLSLLLRLLRRLDGLVGDGLSLLLLLPGLGDGSLRGFRGGVLSLVDRVLSLLLHPQDLLLLSLGRGFGLGERQLSLGEGNLSLGERRLGLSLGGGDLLIANFGSRSLSLRLGHRDGVVRIFASLRDCLGGFVLGNLHLVLGSLDPRLGVVVSLRDLRLHLGAQSLEFDALSLLRGDDVVSSLGFSRRDVFLRGGDSLLDGRVGASLRLLLDPSRLLLSLLGAFERRLDLGGGHVLSLRLDLRDLLLEIRRERLNLLRRRLLDAFNLLLGIRSLLLSVHDVSLGRLHRRRHRLLGRLDRLRGSRRLERLLLRVRNLFPCFRHGVVNLLLSLGLRARHLFLHPALHLRERFGHLGVLRGDLRRRLFPRGGDFNFGQFLCGVERLFGFRQLLGEDIFRGFSSPLRALPRRAHLPLQPLLRLLDATARFLLRPSGAIFGFDHRRLRGALRVFNLLPGDLLLDHLSGADVVLRRLTRLLELRERRVPRALRVGDANARRLLRGGHLVRGVGRDAFKLQPRRLGGGLRVSPRAFGVSDALVAVPFHLLQGGLKGLRPGRGVHQRALVRLALPFELSLGGGDSLRRLLSDARHRLVHVAHRAGGVGLGLGLRLGELGGGAVGLGGGGGGCGVDVSALVADHALRQPLRLDLVFEVVRRGGEARGRVHGLRRRRDVAAAADRCLLVGEALGELARRLDALGD